jgi:hypothetical protein
MNRIQSVTIISAVLAVAACNPFRSPMKKDPVVELSTKDANINSRWTGNLTTPSNLAGVAQINGTVVMQPGSRSGVTFITLDLANASPGGVHPWFLHYGQCGSDQGVFGPASAYKSLKIDDKGHSSGSANIALDTPIDGRFYVSVGASAANPETIVACGNMAAPSR